MSRITPCLWFDTQAEDAAKFYVSVFKRRRKGSKITSLSRYGEAGREVHGRTPGSVMAVEFTLGGEKFVALNAGPQFPHTEAVSFMVDCKDQKELDYFWDALQAGGGTPSMCGWLKDKFGLSWQVCPTIWPKLMGSKDKVKAGRAMQAMMSMRKLDIARLKAAYDGK